MAGGVRCTSHAKPPPPSAGPARTSHLRDSAAGWLAGRLLACITCHGPDLRGLNDAPPIAGRSPSHLVRQLYDVKQGTRRSPLSLTMLPVVAQLTNEDYVNIAAYVSSRSAGP